MSVERHLVKETLIHVLSIGNNAEACVDDLCTAVIARSIQLMHFHQVFADLEFSGVKILSRVKLYK